MEARRSTLGVAVLDGSIVAVGGFDGSTGLCSAEMLDPRQGNLVTCSSFLMWTHNNIFCSAFFLSFTSAKISRVSSVYTLYSEFSYALVSRNLGQWMALPSMTTRRSSVGVAAMNSIVYAVGGYDGQSRQCLSSVGVMLCFSSVFHFLTQNRNFMRAWIHFRSSWELLEQHFLHCDINL